MSSEIFSNCNKKKMQAVVFLTRCVITADVHCSLLSARVSTVCLCQRKPPVAGAAWPSYGKQTNIERPAASFAASRSAGPKALGALDQGIVHSSARPA
jgi:hypothetical protein